MEVARHWRLKKQRYSLVGKFAHTAIQKYPPRDICPDCRGRKNKELYSFSGRGEVYSFTHRVRHPPAGYEENAPYTVALIKLNRGPMVTAQLTNLDGRNVQIGAPVEMVTRKLRNDGDERGMLVYGYKFRPTFNSSAK